MNDDINTDFLEEPSSAAEEILESLEEENHVDSEQDTESALEGELSGVQAEEGQNNEAQSEMVGTNDPSASVSSDAYGIYRNFDIPVTGVHVISSADPQAVTGNEVISDDNIYSVRINNSDFDIYVPTDFLDDLAICDGVLYNMGAETVTCAVLNSDRSGFLSDTLVVLLPVASTNGITARLRYQSYSYYRVYTESSNYGGYTSDDYYGSVQVLEEPPLFSGQPYTAVLIFAVFAVLGFYLLKKIFRKREV